MSTPLSVLSRRQFLKTSAVFVGIIPLVNLTFPSLTSAAAFIPDAASHHSASSASVSDVAFRVLVLDTGLTMRAQLIAAHLTEAGLAAFAADSLEAVPQTSSRLHVIGMGQGVSHALRLASTDQVATLILDTADPVDQDLRAPFEMLKTSPIKTLIVHDLSAPATLVSVTRFLERYALSGF